MTVKIARLIISRETSFPRHLIGHHPVVECNKQCKILCLNAQSIKNKFDDIASELINYNADIVGITKTWLARNSYFNYYKISGYTSYFNNKSAKEESGAMILIRSNIRSIALLSDYTDNDAYYMSAIAVGQQPDEVIVLVVYRTKWSSASDTKELACQLDKIASRYNRVILMGDFNLPNGIYEARGCPSNSYTDHLLHFIVEHDLTQLETPPARKSSKLNLLFVSHHYIASQIIGLLPIEGAENDGLQLNVPEWSLEPRVRHWPVVDYQHLGTLFGKK